MAAALTMSVAVVAACSSDTSGSSPTASASPAPTIAADFNRYLGAYATADGRTWVTNASGQLLSLSDSVFRQLYATATADRFTYGPSFGIAAPAQAAVSFHLAGNRADRMTIAPAHGASVTAQRMPFKETDVRIPGNGVTLAGTITEPVTGGSHPGIVIIHGSEPGQRFYYGVWVGFYASLGFTVLSYDKRGHGQSTGTYPGEFASEAALNTYADDANAALRFIASWPAVDPHRVGFYGGSQGGWTVPLAIARYHAPAAFAVLLSAPAVTVDQQGTWSDYTGSSSTSPSASLSDMQAAVRAMPDTPYNPKPILAQVTQPILWLNGSVDWQVPTAINTEILQGFHRADWELHVLPDVDHGLFVNPSGLEPDEARATHLASVWALIASWLARTAGSQLMQHLA